MKSFDHHFLSIPRYFLTAVGQWPFEDSRMSGVRRIIVSICLLSHNFGIIIVATTSLIVLVTMPAILDILIPLNETRQQWEIVSYDYLIDTVTYRYPIYLYNLFCFITNVFVVVATDATNLSVVLYIGGLFEVVGYRFEHMFDDVHLIHEKHRDSVLTMRIAKAVLIHKKSLDFARTIISCYAVPIVIQLGLMILAITILLYNMLISLVTSNDIVTKLVIAGELVCHYSVPFMFTMAGQIMLDTNTDIFCNIYGGYWYRAPLKVQKLMIFLMINTTEPFVMSFYGLFNMTLELYKTIVQTTFSCFTVLLHIKRE